MTQSSEATAALFGAFDANVKIIEKAFNVRVSNRNGDPTTGDALVVSGEREDVVGATKVLEYLKRMIGDGEALSAESIEYVIGVVKDGAEEGLADYSKDVVCTISKLQPCTTLLKKAVTILIFGPGTVAIMREWTSFLTCRKRFCVTERRKNWRPHYLAKKLPNTAI